MGALLEDPAQQIKRLQRCIHDLISLLALPAISNGNQPSQILHILLDVLLRMLSLDFVYARLKDPAATAPIEILRVADSCKLNVSSQEIARVLANWLGGDGPKPPLPPERNRFGDEELSIFPVPLGVQGEIGMIVVGSDRADFPGQIESLLLSVAANQASIGLQGARLLSEQKRIANELEQRVAERTSRLAAANEELRKEIAERKKIEERLLQSEADLQKAFDEIKKSEAKLRQVIDAIPTLAWCNLPDGPNEFLNKGWHEYTGLSPEESHGWGWQVAFHPEDLPPLIKKWQELLASGEPGEIEARLRRHDGVYRWFLIRVEPFRDETGKIHRW
jgi:PAS domain S-box-containing protein